MTYSLLRMGVALAIIGSLFALFVVAVTAHADHSWGGYHWARAANPLNLKLGDNLSTAWDSYLVSASTDWNASPAILQTAIVSGKSNPKSCRATSGRVEVCNSKYGSNGWLGVASIWVSSTHITQATVKLNDTYFNTSTYNKPAWRRFVACQELGHTFGLDHQDEVFTNINLGTCMDYTNDPSRNDGVGDNLLPNQHDYDELALLYAHLDDFNSSSSITASPSVAASDIDTSDASEWGKVVRRSRDGRASLHERNLGHGQKLFTFVIWAD